MMHWDSISDAISTASNQQFRLQRVDSVGGGCINSAYRLVGERNNYFVKLNQADRLDMFEAEAEGLRALAEANAIKIPLPVCSGIEANQAYLVLEYFEGGGANSHAAESFGQQLAAMHRHTHEQFGWYRDNTIGSTHQPNKQADGWLSFWRQQRLGFQLNLAEQHGASHSLLRKGEELMQLLDGLFTNHDPEASLLHGDLWSGNYAITRDGEPIIFDPAVYFGDRETDLAMTELFGGFSQRFYGAYQEAWPLDNGYRERKILYNLYHILNHFNMFGGGYAGQAERMTEQLLSELR
jgi:protein-ribulosamine 3-kinase